MCQVGYHYYSRSRPPSRLIFFLSRPNHVIRSDFVSHPAGFPGFESRDTRGTHTAYLPHSSFVPFLSAIAAIRVAGAHAILIAHGHFPIAALSSVHINFPVISYTYTALVVLFRPCDVCLCGRSQSSGRKHRGGQTEQTSGRRL